MIHLYRFFFLESTTSIKTTSNNINQCGVDVEFSKRHLTQQDRRDPGSFPEISMPTWPDVIDLIETNLNLQVKQDVLCSIMKTYNLFL